MISPQDERRLYELVRWRNRDFRDHADFEDIVSEALLLAWQSYLRNPGMDPERRLACAVGASRHGFYFWLRRWRGRDGSDRIRKPLATVGLEVIAERAGGRFEGRLIARIEGERLWQRVAAAVAPRQRQVLERVILKGETFEECGANLGMTRKDAWKYHRNAIRRCRAALQEGN